MHGLQVRREAAAAAWRFMRRGGQSGHLTQPAVAPRPMSFCVVVRTARPCRHSCRAFAHWVAFCPLRLRPLFLHGCCLHRNATTDQKSMTEAFVAS